MTGRRTTATRTGLVWLVLAAVGLTGCGGEGGTEGGPAITGSEEEQATPALTFPTTTVAAADEQKAAPRWVGLATFSGEGSQETAPFEVADHAIQWRVRWSCTAGDLRIDVLPEPGEEPLVSAACPQEGSNVSIKTGSLRLDVESSGTWQATVDQQGETPANEPPLPGMESAPVLSSGQLYEIDEFVQGTVTLYQMPDGSRALRFEDFRIRTNVDLEIWLSEAPAPTTSAEAVGSPYVVLGPLTATIGPRNYVVPVEVPTERIKSIVIWCPPILSAYAAATMA